MIMQALVALIVTAVLMAASALGVTQALGAHPFWAIKTGLIGSAVGLLIYLCLQGAGLRFKSTAIIGGLALVLSGLAAVQGKTIFAASYAENALAGQFWFFGWIAVMAALCVTLSAIATRGLLR